MYERYCELRDKLNLKDADVAKACGITPSTFSDWKKGKSAPNADKQRKIAAFLNVSVEYLATGKNTERISTDGTSYYFDDETAAAAQELFENKDLRVLMDAARDSKPAYIKMVTDMLLKLKETNPDG